MNHDFFRSRWVSPFQLDWKLQYIKNWCDSSANYKWCYHSFGCCLECISLEMQCEWNASDNFEAKNRVAGNGEHKLHCLKNAILMIVSQSKRFSGIIFCVVPSEFPFHVHDVISATLKLVQLIREWRFLLRFFIRNTFDWLLLIKAIKQKCAEEIEHFWLRRFINRFSQCNSFLVYFWSWGKKIVKIVCGQRKIVRWSSEFYWDRIFIVGFQANQQKNNKNCSISIQ